MARSFSATTSKWVSDSKRAQRSIFASSAQALAQDVTRTNREGGLLPIDTGNLQTSFTVSQTAMPQIDAQDQEYARNDWTFTIASAHVGDPLYMGFRAPYGPRQNYGFQGTDSAGRTYNQGGKFFIEASAAKWNKFVKEAERLHAIK